MQWFIFRFVFLFLLIPLNACYDVDSWSTISNKGIECTAPEFKGDLGLKSNATACLQVATTHQPPVNYAIWRNDHPQGNSHCYICDLSDRGNSSSWQWYDMEGAISFVGPSTEPTKLIYFNTSALHVELRSDTQTVERISPLGERFNLHCPHHIQCQGVAHCLNTLVTALFVFETLTSRESLIIGRASVLLQLVVFRLPNCHTRYLGK